MPDRATPAPLKRSSVFLVVLLSFVTGGVYTGIWYLRRRKGLNLLDSTSKLGVTGPASLIMLSTANLALPADSMQEALVVLAVGLTNLVMAFRVRWMIVDHLRSRIAAVLPQSAGLQEQYKPSSLLTFFLNIFYLQYKLNELVQVGDIWATAPVVSEEHSL